MDNFMLTKDADTLLCVLYKEYLDRRKAGNSKSDARYLGGAKWIHENLMSKWSVEDIADTCAELSDQNLLDCFWADNTVFESALTDRGIYYMENRFKDGVESFFGYLEKLRSILPW